MVIRVDVGARWRRQRGLVGVADWSNATIIEIKPIGNRDRRNDVLERVPDTVV
jgi:hypothetical protein